MKWLLTLERRSVNKLNAETVKKKLRKIAEAAARNQSLGFVGRVGKLAEPTRVIDDNSHAEAWRYLVRLRLEKETVRSKDAAEKQFEHVLGVVKRCAESEGWSVIEGKPATLSEQESVGVGRPQEPRPDFEVPELTPAVMSEFFGGIYEREEHIRTIHDSVQTMFLTKGELVNHIMLEGLPGACKTLLCERFKAWYEHSHPQVERISFVDGTTMSKAGLENWLISLVESNCQPDILVVDELEKQATENLSCLNGVMGSGILAKLNANIGNNRQNARLMVIGICNDPEALHKTSLGRAITDRFSHRLHCCRPSRELCLRILTEMVGLFEGGKPEWAKLALDFGWDVLGERSIRTLKRHLSGRQRLETGEWQKDQYAIEDCKQKEHRQLLSNHVTASHSLCSAERLAIAYPGR